MTQTEPNAPADLVAPRFPIHDEYDAHPASGFDWRVKVVFELEAGRVTIQDRWGDGTPAREWNGLDIQLATVKGSKFANMTPLVEFLESDRAQSLLADLAEGHEVEWDGSNHVGRLTQDALDAREILREKLESVFEHLPTYWTAEEWFAHGDHGLTGRESDDDLADRVAAEMSRAVPHYLQAADLLRYLTERRDELATEQAEQVAGHQADLVGPRFPIRQADQVGPPCILSLAWDAFPEPNGWFVEVIRGDYVLTDSDNASFPVNVDRFQRHQRADLVAALLTAFPGAKIRD